MIATLITAAALSLGAAPASAGSAAAQLGADRPLVFHRASPRVVERLPVIDDPGRPWIKSTPDRLTIDLRGTWGYQTRRQGTFGTCSAFAAVALAEAAVDRNGGRCVRLSEADLYMQGNVLQWDCWKDPRKDCSKSVEGRSVYAMLHDILTVGVLPGDDYTRIMGVYQKALDDDHDLAEKAAAPKPRRWFSRYLAYPFDWSLLFGHDNTEIRREVERYARVSRSADAAQGRRSIARGFAGYRIVFGKADDIRNRWEMKPGSECFQRGKGIARFIDGELLQGRPVAVGMYIDSLKEWPTDAKGYYSGHAFLIDGLTLTRDANGVKKVYTTRNSWSIQPTVSSEELCRVSDALSLLGPGEREAPPNPWALLRP